MTSRPAYHRSILNQERRDPPYNVRLPAKRSGLTGASGRHGIYDRVSAAYQPNSADAPTDLPRIDLLTQHEPSYGTATRYGTVRSHESDIGSKVLALSVLTPGLVALAYFLNEGMFRGYDSEKVLGVAASVAITTVLAGYCIPRTQHDSYLKS